MTAGRHTTWEVDYEARTITVTVRLDFYSYGFTLTDVDIARVWRSIERFWNFGGSMRHKFKCFEVTFKLDARVADGWSDVRPDAHGVELVDRPVRAHTMRWSKLPWNDDYRSDDPDAGLDPTDGAPGIEARHSTWSTRDPDGYPHEFGHVLGLHDSYMEDAAGTPVPRPGITNDFMGTGKGLSPESMTRVIRRSGQVDESKMNCSMAFDAGPVDWDAALITVTNMRIHAWACDYDPPSDDPDRRPGPIEMQGRLSYGGSFMNVSGQTELRLSGTLEAVDPVKRTGFMRLDAVGHDDIYFHAEYGWMTGPGLPTLNEDLWVVTAPSALLGGGTGLRGSFSHGADECK